MSIFLKNAFNNSFDRTDDIAIMPHWVRCVWFNFVNATKTRHYRVMLSLEEAKKFRDYLSKAIEKVEKIKEG